MITSAICNSYKVQKFEGLHQPGDDYRMALYTASATLDKDTTAYTTTEEVAGEGYTAGGKSITGFATGLAGDVAYVDFNDVVWAAPTTLSARGCLIYNATRANKAVAVYNFGEQVQSTNGPFTVIMPAPGATAVIREA